ncbi:MAG: hypothetical protein RRX92_02295 [Lachnospiraceae bacterium]
MKKTQKLAQIVSTLLLTCLLALSTCVQTYAVGADMDGKISSLGPVNTGTPGSTTGNPAPTAVLHLGQMTLSNMPPASLYSVDNQVTWITCVNGGTVSLAAVMDDLRPGGSIFIYIPAIEEGKSNSDMQCIDIGQFPAPSGFQVNQITATTPTGSITGLNPASMEFSYDDGYSWVSIASGTVSNLDAGTYFIRTKSYGTNLASDPAAAVIDSYIPPAPTPKEPTPNAGFDARTMTLSSIPSRGAYSLDGSAWTSASGSVELRNIKAPSNIYVKALGNGSSTIDSDVQTITITKQPSPNGVTPIPASSSTGLGGLSNVNSGMKYRIQGESSWRGISTNPVTGLIPGVYEVVTIADGTRLDSDSIRVTITISRDKNKAPTPNGSFDAASMMLYNVSVGMAYTYNGGHDWTTITDSHANKVSLSDSDASSAISNGGIRLKALGNGITTIDSDVQVVGIAKASPPNGIATTSSDNAKNGSIQNVNSSMEYAKQDGNWNAITGTSVNGLESGRYNIRVKASGYTIASPAVSVVIDDHTSQVKEATPNASFDARTMTLSNIRYISFSLDGGDNWTRYDDKDLIVLPEDAVSAAKGIKLYHKGDGHSQNSEAQIIKLTRAGAPTQITISNATPSTLGSISGVNHYMQYKPTASQMWIDIAENTVSNLTPGAYQVRVHGQNNVLASPVVDIVISSTTNAPATTNTTNKTNKTSTTNASSSVPAPTTTEKTNKDAANTTQIYDNLPVEDPNDAPISNTESETEPILVDHNQVKGWKAILDNIVPSQPLLIELHGSSTLPASILQAAKANGSDIVIGMDNHVQWSIPANSITDDNEDIDLQLTDSAVAIPDAALHTVTDMGMLSKEFTIVHEGNFGFTAYLSLPIYAEPGTQARLLYYNPSDASMELIDSCSVDDSGYGSFQLKHASAYAIMIGDAAINTTASQDTSDLTTPPKAQDRSTLFIFICVSVIVTILMISLLIVVLKLERYKRNKK